MQIRSRELAAMAEMTLSNELIYTDLNNIFVWTDLSWSMHVLLF